MNESHAVMRRILGYTQNLCTLCQFLARLPPRMFAMPLYSLDLDSMLLFSLGQP